MNIFNDIKTGLEQAIEYEKGNGKARIKKLTVTPLSEFEAKEIREIRLRAGLTQVAFASYMGVSVKTIEAWESGRNRPEGPSCRLLAITKSDPEFPQKYGIIAT